MNQFLVLIIAFCFTIGSVIVMCVSYSMLKQSRDWYYKAAIYSKEASQMMESVMDRIKEYRDQLNFMKDEMEEKDEK